MLFQLLLKVILAKRLQRNRTRSIRQFREPTQAKSNGKRLATVESKFVPSTTSWILRRSVRRKRILLRCLGRGILTERDSLRGVSDTEKPFNTV